MEDFIALSDELGPFKVIHVQEPSVDMKATLVVDNVALGQSIGGIRMAPDVSTEECARLARAMTLKNAAAGLAHGGGKLVLYGDPKMPLAEKEQIIRCMACALKEIEQYVFAPDMGTDEQCMTWIKDEVDRVVGLPTELGGIPLDQIGATGWGLSHVTDIAAAHCGIDLQGARLVVQGFGAVGSHTANFLSQKGTILVAAADSGGTVFNPDGLDVEELITLKKDGRSVTEYKDGEKKDGDAIIDIECEIWVPAARPDVINETNMHRLRTKLFIEGANIPITTVAERHLQEKGILCVPDFIANAGGVICAAMEFEGATQKAAFEQIEEKLRSNTSQLLQMVVEENLLPREAAVQMAMKRIKKVMGTKRWHLF